MEDREVGGAEAGGKMRDAGHDVALAGLVDKAGEAAHAGFYDAPLTFADDQGCAAVQWDGQGHAPEDILTLKERCARLSGKGGAGRSTDTESRSWRLVAVCGPIDMRPEKNEFP
ncbi:hypothetical protein TomTYG45_29880 [Sphingobium sp. TomTYG45]